jgi:hypothetical protein
MKGKRKRTNNDVENTTQKNKDCTTQTTHEIGCEFRYSGRVRSSCST